MTGSPQRTETEDLGGVTHPRDESYGMARAAAPWNEGVVLLIARFSGESGESAFRSAADDFRGVLEVASLYGRDVSHLVPSQSEIIEALRQAVPVKSKTSDRMPFTHRFVEINLTSEHRLHVLVASGSGKKLDDAALQPFVTRAAEVAARVKPTLVVAKRVDRMARKAWGIGPLMLALENLGHAVYLTDEVTPPQRIGDGQTDMSVFFRARAAEDEADRMPPATRRGKRLRTAAAVGDPFKPTPYAMHQAPPPGLAWLRMRSGAGKGDMAIAFDMPDVLPDPETVAYGMPKVFDESTVRVDQVANVRWALAQLGAGREPELVGNGLIARRFSTAGLRMSRGDPSAVFENPLAAVGAIIRNLGFYESCTLRRSLVGDEAVEIRDMAPPDGQPWAAAEVFSRIAAGVASRSKRRGGEVGMALSGLLLSVDGRPGRLRKRDIPTRTEPTYAVLADDDLGGLEVTSIPAKEFGELIRNGLRAAGDAPLELFTELTPEPSLEKKQAAKTLEARIATLSGECDAIRAQLRALAQDGTLAVTGRLRADLNRDYEKLSSQAESARFKLSDIKAALLEEGAAAVRDARTVRDRQLLELLASLRDPYDTTFARLWKRCLRDIRVDAASVEIASHRGIRVRITGTLVFTGVDQTYSIPLSHEYLAGAAAAVDDRVAALISGLEEGTPYWAIGVPHSQDLLSTVAERLGSSTPLFYLAQIDDPRLVKAVMRCVHRREGRSVEELSADLQEDEGFIQRLLDTHKTLSQKRQAHWCTPTSRVKAATHLSAALNDGLARRQDVGMRGMKQVANADPGRWTNRRGVGYQRGPCQGCGSHLLAPMRIRHVWGLLCIECRQDSGGVSWDPTYDKYIDGYELWREAGLVP